MRLLPKQAPTHTTKTHVTEMVAVSVDEEPWLSTTAKPRLQTRGGDVADDKSISTAVPDPVVIVGVSPVNVLAALAGQVRVHVYLESKKRGRGEQTPSDE